MKWEVIEKGRATKGDLLALFLIVFLASVILVNSIEIRNNIWFKLIEKDIKDDSSIIKIAKDINDTCKDSDWREDCIINEVDYFQNSITYKSDTLIEDYFYTNNDINRTLNEGNDCEGKSIITADLLKILGFENVYLLIQECGKASHSCVYLPEYNKMINCVLNCEIIGIRRLV